MACAVTTCSYTWDPREEASIGASRGQGVAGGGRAWVSSRCGQALLPLLAALCPPTYLLPTPVPSITDGSSCVLGSPAG